MPDMKSEKKSKPEESFFEEVLKMDVERDSPTIEEIINGGDE